MNTPVEIKMHWASAFAEYLIALDERLRFDIVDVNERIEPRGSILVALKKDRTD